MGTLAPSDSSVLGQLERILASSHFVRSQLLARLLRFIVETTLDGKEQELKEYRLGVDVFDRGPDFDPRVDPTVRMHAAKLRARLAQYYAEEGRRDPLVISIPKGGYAAAFTAAAGQVAAQRPEPEEMPSIAVLPFVSMSGDPENDYFADGLTEELINVLAYVPGLRVVARTSVFRYKNAAKDIREIGNELNAKTVLEGSVRKAGSQLRVTAQLIDTATGYHLFSRTYPRELRDVFAVQEELSASVVAEIMPKVRGEAAHPVSHSHTNNIGAYNLFLKGVYTLANTFPGALESVKIFRQVTEQEPSYAPAWAGMAHSYFVLAWFSILRARDAMPLAREAARRAIELDETLGQGHAVLGMIQAAFEWDWEVSEKCFRRAIELQPSLSIAHHFYSILCLLPQGRIAEAVTYTDHAMNLNPFDPVLGGAASLVHFIAGNVQAAERQHEITSTANPRHPLTFMAMGFGREMKGRHEDAVGFYRKAVEFSNRAPVPVGSLAHALAKTGNQEEAQRLLQELLAAPRPSGFSLAVAHEGLGMRDEAMRWFTLAMEEREPQCVIATVDPRLHSLRSSETGRRLMSAMNLRRGASA